MSSCVINDVIIKKYKQILNSSPFARAQFNRILMNTIWGLLGSVVSYIYGEPGTSDTPGELPIMPRYVPNLPKDREDELRRIAKALVAPGKGILAADESNPSMSKRLDMIKMENNEENRRKYRQMLLCCGKEMSESIGGVILFHETLYQKSDDGTPFVKVLQQNGVVPGIKVSLADLYITLDSFVPCCGLSS